MSTFSALGRYHNVPGYRRSHAEGDHSPRTFHHEDQDNHATGTQILRVDRWIHPRLPVYFPADVDLQARIRRVWTVHRSPKVLLNNLLFSSSSFISEMSG